MRKRPQRKPEEIEAAEAVARNLAREKGLDGNAELLLSEIVLHGGQFSGFTPNELARKMKAERNWSRSRVRTGIRNLDDAAVLVGAVEGEWRELSVIDSAHSDFLRQQESIRRTAREQEAGRLALAKLEAEEEFDEIPPSRRPRQSDARSPGGPESAAENWALAAFPTRNLRSPRARAAAEKMVREYVALWEKQLNVAIEGIPPIVPDASAAILDWLENAPEKRRNSFGESYREALGRFDSADNEAGAVNIFHGLLSLYFGFAAGVHAALGRQEGMESSEGRE